VTLPSCAALPGVHLHPFLLAFWEWFAAIGLGEKKYRRNGKKRVNSASVATYARRVSLAELLPCSTENGAVEVQRALLPLRALTATGLSVLLSQHPRKEKSPLGQSARGSSLFPGHVEIDMDCTTSGPTTSTTAAASSWLWPVHRDAPATGDRAERPGHRLRVPGQPGRAGIQLPSGHSVGGTGGRSGQADPAADHGRLAGRAARQAGPANGSGCRVPAKAAAAIPTTTG
jgi:hypothetical protein